MTAEIEIESTGAGAEAAVAKEDEVEGEGELEGASIEAEVEASAGESSRSLGEEELMKTSLMPDGLVDSSAFDNSKKSFSLEISASDALERELARPPGSSLRNLIISSVFGNMLEWYDFGKWKRRQSSMTYACASASDRVCVCVCVCVERAVRAT